MSLDSWFSGLEKCIPMGQMKKILSKGGEPGSLPVGQDWTESRPLGTSSSRYMNGQIYGYSTIETEFAMIDMSFGFPLLARNCWPIYRG
jgi:hypothetical protein